MKVKNILYDGKVELLFESFKHQYNDFLGEVPSVTQILSIISKPALISWAANMCANSIAEALTPGIAYDELEIQAIVEAGRRAHFNKKIDAGTIGSFIHKWVEQYIKGENPPMPINEGLKNSVLKFLEWVEKDKVKFLVSEQIIFSRKFRYTGTLDFICKIGKDLYIGDLKTSSGIYSEMWLQTSAYRYAREEEFPSEKYKGQLIIRIGKEGDFEIVKVSEKKIYEEMLVGFFSALKLYQTMEKLKEFKGK